MISEATGMIDKRTLEKIEKDAKEAGRDSWYLSWALDTNAEERAKVLLLLHPISRGKKQSLCHFELIGLFAHENSKQ
jgi:translation elongation factor EF-1alpha